MDVDDEEPDVPEVEDEEPVVPLVVPLVVP